MGFRRFESKRYRKLGLVILGGFLLLLSLLCVGEVAYAAEVASAVKQFVGWPPDLVAFLVTVILAFLAPAGLTLIAIGAASEERAANVAVAGLAAVAFSLIGYLISGFAFQYGGLGLTASLPGMEGFNAEWSPFDRSLGPGWGIVGLRGFLLQDPNLDTRAYAFFLTQWIPVIVATLIPLVTLAGKVSNWALLVSGLLMSGFIYPLFGNWVSGGGWLSNLGQNLGWGHGFVDPAGITSIFVLGGGLALAEIWVFRLRKAKASPEEPVHLPPLHFPLMMILGAFLTLGGWLAIALANPLVLAEDIHPITVTGNLFFAAVGGILLPLLYTWFVTGRPDALMTARGLIAGLVAASASAAFVPAWAALVIGASAGFFLPWVVYLVEHLARWDDEHAVVGTFIVPALWGLLAVALFASGRWGIGWNGVGAEGYLGVLDQGVTGYWPAAGFVPDWPGQFQAQLAGAAAALALSGVLPAIVLAALAYVLQALARIYRRLASLIIRMRHAPAMKDGLTPRMELAEQTNKESANQVAAESPSTDQADDSGTQRAQPPEGKPESESEAIQPDIRAG